MTLDVVVETLIKAVIVIGALLTGFAYLTLFERKVQARMQQRPGPNRVGPWGLLQPAADGLKLFFKSSSAPSSRDRFLYLLAPMISIMAALASFAIIPISGPGALNLFGHSIGWYVMNVNIGVLWYFAVTSVGVYGIFLAGYHTEYSGLRFALFFMAEYINMIIVSSVATIVFLGGWWGPFGILPGPWWFLVKVVALLYVYVWLRATLPRMRYDRLMALSWKSLFPLSLAMMMATAIVVVAAQGTI